MEKLFLKGTKCYSPKCPVTRRAYAPGQHGEGKGRRSKPSNYGIQLREKQKVKRMYGVLERQFRRYFHMAESSKGVTGKVLIQLLERRLDNVIYRLGAGLSHAQARQFVRHNYVYINSKRVNIPSYLVEKDDIIEIKNKDKALNKIKENLELSKESRTVPGWLNFNKQELKATVIRLPEKEDIQATINESLIVELYSK
jgi:small subunit ribosomal protein S4